MLSSHWRCFGGTITFKIDSKLVSFPAIVRKKRRQQKRKSKTAVGYALAVLVLNNSVSLSRMIQEKSNALVSPQKKVTAGHDSGYRALLEGSALLIFELDFDLDSLEVKKFTTLNADVAPNLWSEGHDWLTPTIGCRRFFLMILARERDLTVNLEGDCTPRQRHHVLGPSIHLNARSRA